MTMEQFFSKCGAFIYSGTSEKGNAPQRTFIQHFYYTEGYAEFDGRNWKYELNHE